MSSELLNHFLSKHLSINERMASGKALRDKYPRKRLGEFKTSPDRPDPVSILEARERRAWKSWCQSAMRECLLRHLPFSGVAQPSWRPTWQQVRKQRVLKCRLAEICMSRILDCLLLRSVTWFAVSMILMKPYPGPGNGI